MDAAEVLLEEIKTSPCWPLAREKSTIATVRYRRALRRANRLRQPEDLELVKILMGWEDRKPHLGVGDVPREYVHDPLPRKIGQAFADFLWSGEPQYKASAEADQPWLGLMVDENDLTARLHRAEGTLIVPEGEAYAKIHTDREVAISPIITFSSRLSVVPLWKGDHLQAAAFFTEYHSTEVLEVDQKSMVTDVVWRHFEVHADRIVRNALFKGTRGEIGRPAGLNERPETAALAETWAHGLPMLCQRWVNSLDDDDPTLGVSDFDGIIDFQRTLNEARVIAAENARLTAKKRVFVTDDMLDSNGTWDAGSDVVAVGSSNGGTLGDAPNTPPIAAVEYSYDSVPLIAHTDHTIDAMLTAVGLVPQIVGRHVDGQAETGVALKVRLIPTIATAEAKAREPDSKLPLLLQLAAMVDALPVAFGGFNRRYTGLSKPPTVTRDSLLPRDETEVVTDNAQAVNAGIRSRETAVREQWPGWSDPEIQEELDRIDGDFALPELPDAPANQEPDPVSVPEVAPETVPV